MPELPRLPTTRKTGSERFRKGAGAVSFTVQDFWSWSASNLVSNATRGVLAEYIVAQAIGAALPTALREEWDAYDLTSPSGVKVEVKCSAYVQAWHQKDFSKPVFSVRKARYWDGETGDITVEPGRAADVYVFALLAHRDQATIDPLDLAQWEFYVLPRRVLDDRKRSQHSITLPPLEKLCDPLDFDSIEDAVRASAAAN